MKQTPLVTLTATASVLLAGAATAAAQNAAAAPPKKSTWESSAALGLTLTRGNSDTLTFAGNVLSAKKWDRNEINLGVDFTYGENNSVKNNESLHGFAQYNRLFTERLFGYVRLDGTHDAIADIEYRFTLSPGIGYYFVKNETTFLSGEVGPGYVVEKKGANEDSYLTLRLADRFEHKLTATTKIWQSAEILPQVDDFDNFVVNAEIGIDTAITKNMSLRASVQDTYYNQPVPGREKNDLKLITALAYKF